MPKDHKKSEKPAKSAVNNTQPQTSSKKLTPEEAAAIVRDRFAKQPVIIWRYRNGRWNKRFIITLAIMIAALIAALYFMSRAY